MRIDLHAHLAGLGDVFSPEGLYVSARMRRTATYWALRLQLAGLERDAAKANTRFAEALIAHAEGAPSLDYVCAFAMDGAYTESGEFDPARSHLYVPNRYAFEVARRSKKLLPVISVNPMREDAIAELHRWAPEAVALKWLAPLQRFDASQSRHERFLDALAETGLPVIAHTGCEHTFPEMAQELGNPGLYEPLLKRGIPVIFSHCGTGSFLFPAHDYSAEFEALLLRYPNAYGDTSAFASLVRRGQVRRFSRAEKLIDRIFHGSDWPIPTTATVFLPELGFNRVARIERTRNPLERDVLTKREMGLPESVFTGAWAVLGPRVRAWEAMRDREALQ